MPGVDLFGAVTTDESPVLGLHQDGLFNPHKTLQREEIKQKSSLDKQQARRRSKPSRPYQAFDRPSGPYDDRLKSWIDDSYENEDVVLLNDRPLTPPIDFRDNFKSWIDDKALRDRKFLSQQRIDPGDSPKMLGRYATSDTSSARHTSETSTTQSFLNTPRISGGSGSTVRDPTESRTDSFRTARENLPSDSESSRLDSPSLHPSRQRWLQATLHAQPGDIGLGLGLDLESEGNRRQAGEETTPSKEAEKGEGDFVAFDGIWDFHQVPNSQDTESQATARRDSDEKTVEGRAQSDSPTLGVEGCTSTNGGPQRRPTREYREKGPTASPNDEAVREARSPRPSEHNSQPSDAIDETQEKRLSQTSTTSTVVEAMVIESSPPYRRPSLRHTGRIMAFNILHTQQQQYAQNHVQPGGHLLKHPLRSPKNTDQGLRASFALQSTPSPASKSKSITVRPESSNVSRDPDRRSSLQSSLYSSKHPLKASSFVSKPPSSRPTTAPEKAVGYFDNAAPRDHKTISVFIQQATPGRSEVKAQHDSPHAIQSKAIPTATAATEGLARTTSITSRGMSLHYVPQSPTPPAADTPQNVDTHENLILKADRSSSGDWTALRPASTLITPYSLRSAQSSTPGTLEISEATAICIYPHTNESILVIQRPAGGDRSSHHETLVAGTPSIGPPSQPPPIESQPFPTSMEEDAPDTSLQNPRDPPPPPDLKLIPPTPANAASSSEDTVRHVRAPKRHNRFSAPFVYMKRAMSARRYSDSIANPFIFTRTLSLRDNSNQRRPHTVEDNTKETKLHPLWRPRTNWNDTSESDSDSEFGNNGVLSPRSHINYKLTDTNNKLNGEVPNIQRRKSHMRQVFSTGQKKPQPVQRRASISLPYGYVDNRYLEEPLGSESKFTGSKRSQSLTRRIGGSLRLPSRHHRLGRQSTADWDNQPDYELVPVSARQHVLEDLPFQPRTAGLQNFAKRIERRRSLREETKIEERRQSLKDRIKSVRTRDTNAPTRFDMIRPPLSDDRMGHSE